MVWRPPPLAHARNGIDVVDTSSRRGDGGLEGFHLLLPVRHVDRAGPRDLFVATGLGVVELVGQGLGAFGVAVCDEDLGPGLSERVWLVSE